MATLLPELYEAYIRPDKVRAWELWRINNADKVTLKGKAEQLFQDSVYQWRLFVVKQPVLYPDASFGMPFVARAGQRTRPPDVIDTQPVEPEDLLPKLDTSFELGTATLVALGVGIVGAVYLLRKVT